MRALITGASGFVGKPLVEKLSKLGFEILAITRSIPSISDGVQVHWIQADLSIKESYQFEVNKFAPEIIIHLAWQDIPDFSIEKSKANLNQSLEFIYFIAGLKSCKKILFSGSCLEYGNASGECIESKIVKGSKNHFTWAKNSLRKKAELICKKNLISFAWFRIFYVYGPGQRPESLLPSILSKLKEGKLPEIHSLYNANDYIYIDDVVNAFVNASIYNFSSGIYNLGSGFSTNVIQICLYAEKIVLNSSCLSDDLKSKTVHNLPDVNFWAEMTLTTRIFRWKTKTDLVNGIQLTWKNFK